MKGASVEPYLLRIGLSPDEVRQQGPTRELLATLHRAHTLTVPWTNMDLYLGKTHSEPTLEHCWDKLVVRGGGGWCFEHILLFEHVLLSLGFDRVRRGTGPVLSDVGWTPPSAHVFLLVAFDGQEEYLVDLGYPDSVLEPVSVVHGREHTSSNGIRSKLELNEEGYWCKWSFVEPSGWILRWKWDPNNLGGTSEIIADGSHYVQHGEMSPFRKGLIVTLPRPEGGRISLSGSVLITTEPDWKTKTRKQLTSEEAKEILASVFHQYCDGIDVFNESLFERLA